MTGPTFDSSHIPFCCQAIRRGKLAATEDAPRAGSAPNGEKNFPGENFGARLKNKHFPTKLSLHKISPTPWKAVG